MGVLQKEQEDLLITLVEGARNIPHNKRDRFHFIKTESGESWAMHSAISNWNPDCYEGDLRILAQNGLLNLYTGRDGISGFDIKPEGFQRYEDIKQRDKQPVQRMETSVRNYLESERFQKNHLAAFEKWSSAEKLLWQADSDQQLTSIGHFCREAMQEFVNSLVERLKPTGVSENKAQTISRLKSVVQGQSNCLSSTLLPFLDTLLNHWGTLSDMVQRQEHGGQKEGQPLVWEDARRVVFHTAIVMFELDRTIR